MSDDGFGESAKSFGAGHMKALLDTEGMTAPERAFFWLETITKTLHRGPRLDTWATARDSAADFADIKCSMAERIWSRWERMQFVDGEALLKLMIAYEKICEKPEAAAARYRAERSRLRGNYAAAHQRDRRDDLPRGHARHRSSEVSGDHAH